MHFFITDDGTLIPLRLFEIEEGQSSVVPIPTFGGTVYQRSQPAPTTFRMQAFQQLPTAGGFRVVDEDALVYHCLAVTVSIQGHLTIGGIVVEQFTPENSNEARRAVAEAKAAFEDDTA